MGVFAAEASLPDAGEAGEGPGLAEPWRVIGRVLPDAGDGILVTVDGDVPDARGWDHFAG